jgi:hypothetical protein
MTFFERETPKRPWPFSLKKNRKCSVWNRWQGRKKKSLLFKRRADLGKSWGEKRGGAS